VVARTVRCQQHWRQMRSFESAMRETERRCRTLLNSSRDAIAYVHEGMHIYANDSYLELFGYTDIDDVEGTPIMDMAAPDHQATLKEFLRNYDKDSDEAQTLDLRLRDTQDQPFEATMEFSAAAIDGEPCTQILIRNRGDAQQLEQQLSYLSQRDLITGLYNRQYLIEQLQRAIAGAVETGTHQSLLYIGIDQFEKVKTQVGVSGSDLVIADVARLLDDASTEEETIARFEGATYALLTPVWDRAKLEARMDEVIKLVADHICEVEGKSVSPTISIGAVLIDENVPDENELLLHAERARSEAAAGEGGRAVIYKPKEGEMTQKQLDEAWGVKLRDAVRDNRLRLMFQPLVSLHGETGERYEIDLQLLDEQGQVVAKSEFLPSAERTGMAKALDRWVMVNAVKRLSEHRREHPETSFFIKLTAGSLQDADILPWFVEKLTELRVPAESLTFVVNERTALEHLKKMKEFAKGLTSIKCGIALDEFGAGLKPFELLKQVPALYLKLEASFMHELANNTDNQKAVQDLTETAHSMNRLVIAQQVNDPNTLSVLWGMGVNYIQGSFVHEASEQPDYDFSSMG
jgi:diguanylate cyclase (GGDEF)-like protein/PAS domain S-box-containing protein